MKPTIGLTAALVLLTASAPAQAQPGTGPRPPEFRSTEVSPEGKITFRIHAPRAEAVRLVGGDLPGSGFAGVAMSKADNGVWEAEVGPFPAGAYRYQFNVDGVPVIDPRNGSTSESNANTWSLVIVPGSELFDLRDLPHGAVAQIAYHSRSLHRFRRMHVYTPPGYEQGKGEFPVFYLLHGALDSDASWSTVGRAGVILDNLIAAGRARPMIVVMPHGHTGPFSFGGPGGNTFNRQMEEFGRDFVEDLRPHIEKNYRVRSGRAHRAIAGLSMGGAQTLNIAFENLKDYAYVGVFSSGVFGIAGGFVGSEPSTQWEDSHRAVLDNAELRQGLALVWFATGKDDFLIKTTQATVSMLKSHGIEVVYDETAGGHTWLVWRDYLSRFAPLLFAE